MRAIWLLSFLTATLAGPAALSAGPTEGQVSISVLGGAYQKAEGIELRTGDENWGGTIGWAPTDRWSVEAMFFEFEPGVEVGGVSAEGDMEYWSMNLIGKLGNVDADRFWQPYVVLGGGSADFEYDGLRGERQDNLWHTGFGFFGKLSERLQLRADVRGVYHHDADDVSGMATAGLTLLLGGAPKPPPAPADSDGDGVADPNDACPATPAGTAVDSRGCPRDSDNDGVVDGDDACPRTPAGVSVDTRGCPLDSDGDGVADQRDDCPGTPAGARVDANGCEVQLEREVSFDLTMQFATNSAEITGAGMQEMFDLLRFLRQYPSADAVIEGHTDSTGAAEYNQDLSERRAQAVVQALVNSGIDRGRLTARGYGESRPVASNDTPTGRAQNRRVTVVVEGTTTE